MISTTQIAKEIENRLNQIAAGASLPFVFQVYANIGEYQAAQEDPMRKKLPTPIVNGVLIAFPAQIAPLQGVKSFVMQQLLTIYAPVKPSAEVNGVGIEEVMSVVNAFAESGAGLAGTMSDGENSYAYVFAPQLPSVGSEGWELGMPAIPVSISLAWQFIEGGVVGNNVKITVGGQAAVLLEGGFSRTRIADTNPREGSEEMTTVIGQQGLTLRVLVPYISGGVGQKLVTDALTGALDKTYAVTYSDVVAFTDNAPFSALMVATNIAFSFNPGTTCSVDATFVLADGEVYDNA